MQQNVTKASTQADTMRVYTAFAAQTLILPYMRAPLPRAIWRERDMLRRFSHWPLRFHSLPLCLPSNCVDRPDHKPCAHVVPAAPGPAAGHLFLCEA